jgi:hypothetical protein
MPLPHALQVPSSQLGPVGAALVSDALASAEESRARVASSREEASSLGAAERGSGAEALPEPHPATSKRTAKKRVGARIVPSVYVPSLWRYKSL